MLIKITMKKLFLILLIIPFLSNCTQYSAMLSPSITLASGGTLTQATTSLSSSLAMNKAKSNYMAEKKVEKILETPEKLSNNSKLSQNNLLKLVEGAYDDVS